MVDLFICFPAFVCLCSNVFTSVSLHRRIYWPAHETLSIIVCAQTCIRSRYLVCAQTCVAF